MAPNLQFCSIAINVKVGLERRAVDTIVTVIMPMHINIISVFLHVFRVMCWG